MDGMKSMKSSKFLTPYFAGIFVVAAMLVYYAASYAFSLKFGFFDIEEVGVTEITTYLFYGFAAGVATCCAKDFWKTPDWNTFCGLMFLWIAALFRELGIQHWLTSHDTVITKSRFFTNPNNPLYEKVIAGLLMSLVLLVLIIVVCKCSKKLITGLVKFHAVPWTTVTFIIFAIVTQIVDRFPANYMKATGVALSDHTFFVCKIFEEGGESLLPLLFAIALLQYHYCLKASTRVNKA